MRKALPILILSLGLSACATPGKTRRAGHQVQASTTYSYQEEGDGRGRYSYCDHYGNCYEENCQAPGCQGEGDPRLKRRTLAEKIDRDRKELRRHEQLRAKCDQGHDDSCILLVNRSENLMQDFFAGKDTLQRFREVCLRPTLDCRLATLKPGLPDAEQNIWASWESMPQGKRLRGSGRGHLYWSENSQGRRLEIRKRQ